jgi:hypothetical protein
MFVAIGGQDITWQETNTRSLDRPRPVTIVRILPRFHVTGKFEDFETCGMFRAVNGIT